MIVDRDINDLRLANISGAQPELRRNEDHNNDAGNKIVVMFLFTLTLRR